ncbi:MAG: redoxin domain-containing protein [Verrucomicrobia bacterium]|jgi:cytochrome c biogenesis protein CcmG/thiol:disulfide interchange protein DsbE|nr:redoxin domain-containing protein [Verrucomicrobiota bacterium]
MAEEKSSPIPRFFKRNAFALLAVGGIATYVMVAGTTGSCGACSAITSSLGLPPANVQAAGVAGGGSAMDADAREAPEWTLRNLEGEEVRSSDFDGKVVLLDFWATWCPPCRKGIPEFVELQKEYGDDGLVVVGISLDRGGPDVVKPFAEKMGINYPLVMGNQEITEQFGGIRGIPTSFLINREGEIVEKHVGYTPKNVFVKQIKPLL